jgi:hypothetical protein
MAGLAAVNPQIAELVNENVQMVRASMSHGGTVNRRE